MNKLFCVVSCPVDTFSGYGKRSYDFLKALIMIKSEEWNIKVLSQRWGGTPFGALDRNNPTDLDILNRMITNIDRQPDIWIQITVPNEFQAVGKFNIGVSALVETSVLPPELLEGMNRMHLNIVSSQHGKNIATQTKFDKLHEHTKQKIAELKLEKPVEILFEGVDTTVYQNKNVTSFDLSSIPEQFCFLVVGHLLQGVQQMEDRKMIGVTIRAFIETFKNKKSKPALILKCSTGGYSNMDEEQTMKVVESFIKNNPSKDLPNIYVIHGELTDQEMNGLYNNEKVKAFINVGNEGYGRPELEFSAGSSKPVIASPWGGHIDFLSNEFTVFVGGKLDKVHDSAINQFIIKDSLWFKPEPMQVSLAMTDMFENYNKFVDNGKRLGYRCKTQFNFDKMVESLQNILNTSIPKMSIPTPVKLPKLKTVSVPEDLVEIK